MLNNYAGLEGTSPTSVSPSLARPNPFFLPPPRAITCSSPDSRSQQHRHARLQDPDLLLFRPHTSVASYIIGHEGIQKAYCSSFQFLAVVLRIRIGKTPVACVHSKRCHVADFQSDSYMHVAQHVCCHFLTPSAHDSSRTWAATYLPHSSCLAAHFATCRPPHGKLQ
jgi:hypothetical protein